MNRLIYRHTWPLQTPRMAANTKRKFVTIEDFFSKSKKPKGDNNESKEVVNTSADNNVERSLPSSQDETNAKKKSKEEFQNTLSSMLSNLLLLEIENIELSWFTHLQSEFKKPYFVKLKQFVQKEQKEHTVFPPPRDIYSWTRLTPFDQVRVVVIGQDPYHNHNQAHGLAFSVREPIPAPPSLKNIYKELQSNYKDFKIDNSVGDLTPWALQGVLLLNTALTVRAHNANSHSKKGWETLATKAIEALIKNREKHNKSLVFLLWGSNAQKLIDSLLDPPTLRRYTNIKVFKSVHPSPLSAQRGFFGNNHFRQINDWLYHQRGEKMIDWSVAQGSQIKEVAEANAKLESNV